MHHLLVLLILTWVYLFQPNSAAANVLFEDTFDQGLASWQPIRDTGQFWISQNGYIEVFIPNAFKISELVPLEWQEKPTDHYRYDLTFTPIQGLDRNISFSFQDIDNWYLIHFAPHTTELAKMKNNQVVWSERHPFILQNGKQYQVTIIFNQGKITLSIDDTEIATFQDPDYQAETGIITLRAGTGAIYPARVRFEEVRVTDLSQPPALPHGGVKLETQLLKQTDPQWANLEYNTASVWSAAYPNTQPTFKDWACNLLAQIMIMQYHGLTTLPDGTPLSPISYNTWLLENHGFIRSPHTGNISRLSASQLSQAISTTLNTPKLEFNFHPSPTHEAIIAEINAERPVILELDGHFVVADGYTADGDIYISDPAYSIELLSEHPLPLRSMRTYHPTMSDLSFLEIISDPEITLMLTMNDQEVGQQSTEYLRAGSLTTDSYGPLVNNLSLAKPALADYSITAVNTADTDQQFEVLLTNQVGEVVLFDEQTIKPGMHYYDLSYFDEEILLKKNDAPESEEQDTDGPQDEASTGEDDEDKVEQPEETSAADWQLFRQAVFKLQAEQAIKRQSLVKTLLKMPTLIEKAHSAYISTILTRMVFIILDQVPAAAITDAARQELKDLLSSLTSV
ncbi:MAG: C39 family peptidase [Patescibacteria group bacterium]